MFCFRSSLLRKLLVTAEDVRTYYTDEEMSRRISRDAELVLAAAMLYFLAANFGRASDMDMNMPRNYINML